MPDDDGKPTFDEIKDAMMPPGTDKDALWEALKGAHRTGGHVPGQQAGGEVAAEAGPGEDGFGQNGAFEQEGVGEGDDGEQLDADVAEGMAPDHAPA